jgi:hypothetical protein
LLNNPKLVSLVQPALAAKVMVADLPQSKLAPGTLSRGDSVPFSNREELIEEKEPQL